MVNSFPPWLAPPQSQAINFNGYCFTEPSATLAFGNLLATAQPGIYVILAYDGSCHPRPCRALYFGQSYDVYSRATPSHEGYGEWQREAGQGTTLYRAFYFMPGSTQTQRQAVESSLIAQCNPPCN